MPCYARASCSGGCGSFYAITIASEKLEGLPILKQHRTIKDVLKDDMAGLHGLQVRHFHSLTAHYLTAVLLNLVEGCRPQVVEFSVHPFATPFRNRPPALVIPNPFVSVVVAC